MLPTKIYKAKQFIYKEGETASELYIIKSGSVRIIKNLGKDQVTIGVLEKGSFFGEVALFLGEQHGATAVADTDLELAAINKETFNQHFAVLPEWFQTLFKSMAERLRDSIEQLGTSRKESSPDPTAEKEKHTDSDAVSGTEPHENTSAHDKEQS
ncbi:Crp/Fnr family transcriptional regulator [candidate division KSB1 bacterium]